MRDNYELKKTKQIISIMHSLYDAGWYETENFKNKIKINKKDIRLSLFPFGEKNFRNLDLILEIGGGEEFIKANLIPIRIIKKFKEAENKLIEWLQNELIISEKTLNYLNSPFKSDENYNEEEVKKIEKEVFGNE